jgi:hypothetical protein
VALLTPTVTPIPESRYEGAASAHASDAARIENGVRKRKMESLSSQLNTYIFRSNPA